MKRLFFALLSIAGLSASAQTVDEVIQKYNDAMGGLDAFNKVASAKMTGTVTVQGTDFPLTVQMINGKAMRTDVAVMGQSVTNVYKDGKGWKINPFMGAETATDVEGAELNDFKNQASLAGGLMDYKSRGNQVELLGQEDVEAVKTFKIKLTSKDDGRVSTFYISTANYMLVKSLSSREMQGQTVEVETFYSDMKDFAGLKFFMSRSQKIDGLEFQAIKLSNVELNVPIDDKIFNK